MPFESWRSNLVVCAFNVDSGSWKVFKKKPPDSQQKNNKPSEPGDTRGFKIICTIKGSFINRKEIIRRMERRER
jgi:hypothetical protein